jgi:hypothetical protein
MLENDEFEDPLEIDPEEDIDLEDIEGRDPARARFIRGYLKASI